MATPHRIPANPRGIWRGQVVDVIAAGPGAGVYVKVPRLSGAHRYGPCSVASSVFIEGLMTDIGGDPPHDHQLDPLIAGIAGGQYVLIAFVEGRANDVVVLARLPGPA